jgi:hypothetical protein
MHNVGYARLAEEIKEIAHSWLLGKKRKGSGSDRPEPKRMRLDTSAEKGATSGGSGRIKGGKSDGGRGKGGKSRGGAGKGPGGRGKDYGKL